MYIFDLRFFLSDCTTGKSIHAKQRAHLRPLVFLPWCYTIGLMSSYENLDESKQFACRVIADHARSTAFAIADGILPGNEGRNYVLRKIMRRAIYHGREHLGLKDAFFYKVCDDVVERMHGAFPELAVQREFMGKMVRLEEER